ncbi:MAG: RNA polymerase sigma-70 factor [Bacteroidales bacterium]
MKLRKKESRSNSYTAQYVEECYKTHLHKVVRFAYTYLGDANASYDVASEVFTILWERRDSLDFSEDIVPFLMTITKHRSLNRLKRLRVRNSYEKGIYNSNKAALEMNYRSLSFVGSMDIFSKEVEQIIYDSLEEMPESVKNTFIMSRFRELKYHEIAKIEGVSIKAIEKRISTALKILRISLKEYLP